MKKLFLALLVVLSLFIISEVSIVNAQDITLPAPVIQEEPSTQTELPIGEANTGLNTNESSSENKNALEQTSFITGSVAGLLAGFVVGGVLTWFFKDKIIKA